MSKAPFLVSRSWVFLLIVRTSLFVSTIFGLDSLSFATPVELYLFPWFLIFMSLYESVEGLVFSRYSRGGLSATNQLTIAEGHVG